MNAQGHFPPKRMIRGNAVGLLLLALGLPFVVDARGPAREPLPEVAFLPPDLFAVVQVKVGHLWDSIPAREARAAANPAVLAFAKRLATRCFGVPLDEIERLTACMASPDQNDLVLFVATRSVLDREKLLKGFNSLFKLEREQSYAGFKVHLAGPSGSAPELAGQVRAVVWLGPRLFALGRHDLLLTMLDQVRRSPTAGPFSCEYEQFKEAQHLTILVRPKPPAAGVDGTVVFNDVTAAQPTSRPNLPFLPLLQPMALVALLTQFDGLVRVSLQASFEPGCEVKARFDFSNESLARRGLRRCHGAIADLQSWLERLEAWLREPGRIDGVALPRFPGVAALAVSWREGLDQVHLELAGTQIRAVGKFKSPAKDLHLAYLDLAGGIPLAFAADERRSRLNQLALAMHNYHRDYEQFPPPASVDGSGKPLLSWRVLLLPYLDQKPLFDRFKKNEPWDSPHNQTLLPLMPDCFMILGAEVPEPPGCTYYQVFVGAKSLPKRQQPLFCLGRPMSLSELRDLDGGSHTLAIVEGGSAVPWTRPLDLEYQPDRPLPPLGGAFPSEPSFLAATADGTVRVVHRRLEDENRYQKLLRQLITCADGQGDDDTELFK